MNITMQARKTTVKDSFREKVEKKLRKFDRFFDEEAFAIVTVTNERERETVEVTIQSGGMIYRAERTTADRLESLDAVVDVLFKQIVKNKSKLEQRLRSGAFNPSFQDAPVEEPDYRLVRTKRFDLKPMDVEEAILQMNLLGHTFFMFRNKSTDSVCVVYLRHDGSYGLLEPENA